jgi:hypothetical protein
MKGGPRYREEQSRWSVYRVDPRPQLVGHLVTAGISTRQLLLAYVFRRVVGGKQANSRHIEHAGACIKASRALARDRRY